jgi:4'-phosphopantetheinyl transferase EntD
VPVALDDALARLHVDERAHAGSLAPIRRRDWTAGRAALRAALDAAGLACDAPVLADDRGAPVLPAGVQGSVSHKQGIAVALAAPSGPARIGVDVERHAPTRLDVSSRILTPAELATLSTDPLLRGQQVALRFSIKEAIYKAIDPFVRRYVGFREVAVWPDASGAAIVEPLSSDLPPTIDAAWILVGDLVIATARATR